MISDQVKTDLAQGSAVRKMFEEGARLRRLHGAENVFDFSLGNPDLPTPRIVQEALEQAVQDAGSKGHGYMSNAGYQACRETIAKREFNKSGIPVESSAVVMTVGAAGALSVIFKAILNPGEEVLTISPYFGEYRHYVKNAGGLLLAVPALQPGFQPDIQGLLKAITPRTKALLLNNPNNPTGVVYTEESLRALAKGLEALEQTIYVIFDEPYAEIVFDAAVIPPMRLFKNSIIAYSWSKSLSLPGERIGYIACAPTCADYENLCAAFAFCNRTLGFVNAPAIWQRVMTTMAEQAVDTAPYRLRRDLICGILDRCGLRYTRPEGAFYIFPEVPGGDDVAFAAACAEENLLVVPGSGFAAPGYIRICYAVPEDMIRRSEQAFQKVMTQFNG